MLQRYFPRLEYIMHFDQSFINCKIESGNNQMTTVFAQIERQETLFGRIVVNFGKNIQKYYLFLTIFSQKLPYCAVKNF